MKVETSPLSAGGDPARAGAGTKEMDAASATVVTSALRINVLMIGPFD